MTTRRPPLTQRLRPSSQVYLGSDSAYSSYLSSPPDLPDLPEPPSPGSSSSTSTSGLPSPPATNSTGSGSTGDPGSIAFRGGTGGALNMLNGSNIKTFHAAFETADHSADLDDDYNDNDDEDGEDNTARLNHQRRQSASENVLALQRVKSLTQRNKIALDKLSSFSRHGSPAPSAGNSSARRSSINRSPPAPSSSASASDSLSNSNSNSNSASSSSQSSSRPSIRRARTQEPHHQSGSDTERDDSYDHDPEIVVRRPTTPIGPRQRLVSAPASPQKHLTASSHSSGSSTRSPRRNRLSNLSLSTRAVDEGEGANLSSPEDVTRAALAAVASARRTPSGAFSGASTARRLNMSPTTAATGSGGKRRQPLPREWGVGSSSSNGRFSAEPPTSPPQHDTSPNKRHSLAGSTASTSSTSFAGSSRGHAHSNSTSSTSTIGSTVQGREQRASTVRDLTRRHQARYYSEDLGNHSINGGEGDEQRERRQSLRAGSAESALGTAVGGRSLIGEGLRAAGLTGRVDRMGGGDVFQERTPARVEWADGQRSRSVSRQGGAFGNGHGRAATSLDYTAYDRDEGDEPRTAPLLRTYRSSAHVLESAGARAGSAQGRYPDRGMSVERDLRDDRERERHAAPSPSPFGSVASRRHGSGGGGSGQHEHTRLMADSLAMFEGHLARVGGTGDRTAHDLAQSAQKLVNTAERLNAILRAGTKQALEEQIDAEVSGVDSSGGGGADAQDLAEVWRRVGGEYREGLRVSDELVRSVTGLLLGVGRVVRDFGEGRGSDEGRNSASPDAGRRSVESRRSLDKDERRISTGGGRDSALGVRPSSVLNTRHEPTPPSIPRTGTPASRRLLTPREQRELQASAGLVASDSQETVQPKKRDDDYEPSPTPASRKQNQSTLDRSRTLPPISIPKPLPTLPSESASTLRRNQTTGNSSQRRRTITSSTVRAPGGLLHSATPTTALTPHTVSNSPNELRGSEARMSFPSLPRSDSDKSVPPTRSRNNTVTFSRPSNVALAGLQMQHDRERQRTISNSNNQFDAAAIAIAAAAGPSSRSDGEKVTPGKRSTLAVRDRPRASLDGGDSVGPSHAADRSAAAGLSTLGQKRERRRTVTDIWPPNGS